MPQRSSIPLLSALLLLLVLLSCTKKDDPDPLPVTAAPTMGAYQVDGRSYSGKAVYQFSHIGLGSGTFTHDVMSVIITSSAANAPKVELWLNYYKPIGNPATDYHLHEAILTDETTTPQFNRVYLNSPQGAVTQTTAGWSGTFTATSDPTAVYPATSVLTVGNFTDATPR